MQNELLPIGALAIGLAAGLGLAIPTARGDARSSFISVDEIKDGMKGYGLTVFKGTDPERFDLEVVGVLRNFRPGQALILIKTLHPRLDVTKNVKGMSGSPIFLDGRLAGAYAYSWASFQVEPVAGVTPIAPMLNEMRRPIPPGFWPLEGQAPLPGKRVASASVPLPTTPSRTATSFDGQPGTYDLAVHASQIGARRSLSGDGAQRTFVPATTPLMLGGMGERSIALARKLFEPLGLEPVQAGGGGAKVDPAAPQHYVNGGGLAVQLARGDVSLMGLGTVTYVEGHKLCGFGHPMMEAGDTALPAAIGKVDWIFASAQHSSKIGEAARPLGALVQDRQSAVVVDETKTAPTFSFTIDIQGAPGVAKNRWNVEIAEERFMSPSLVASVMSSVVEATTNETRDVTWRLDSKLSVRGHGTIALEDFGVAVGGMPDAGDFSRSKIGRAVGEVLNNPWERVHIDGVSAVLSIDYSRAVWKLRGVDVLDPIVEGGRVARLRVHLQPFAGPIVTKVIDVPLPTELAGKDVELEVGPGYQFTPDLAAPQSLDDLLRNSTKQAAPPKSLVVRYRLGSQGVAFNGHVAEQLPAFALDALRPTSSNTGPDAFASYGHVVVPLDRYVEGSDRARVHVRTSVR